MSLPKRIVDVLHRPVDGLWLALFRIGLGLCLLWQIWKYFSADLIHNFYVEPQFHFTWLLFDSVRPCSPQGMYLHFALLAIAASCITLGFYYRLSAFVFWLGYTWAFLIDQCWYLNHYYLICLLSFLAIFLPAASELSLDAWRHPDSHRTTVPTWTLWLLRLQVAIPYFYGGISKINEDWLAGEPMRTWLSAQTDFPLIGQYFTREWCVMSFVWGGLLLDLLVVPLLLWRWTRIPAMAIALCFHLLNSQLFKIGVFPWMMIWLTLVLFLSPATTARLRIWTRPRTTESDTNDVLPPIGVLRGGLLSIYLCWQLLMPLRHFLYETNTAFTREGHQFSWRMKLNIRGLTAKLSWTDAVSGERTELPLSDWITWHQERKFHDADELLQLTQRMKQVLEADGNQVEKICGDVTVSLNGRPPVRFCEPDLDLTRIQRTLFPGDWFIGQPKLEPLPALRIEDRP